jgi:hypothetical protein
MEISDWLAAAKQDALRRGLPELVPLLEGLAVSTAALRTADESQRRAAAAHPEEPLER